MIEILSPAHAKAAKSLNNFKFGLFIGRFPSDEAASMAVKGLNYVFCCTDETVEADTEQPKLNVNDQTTCFNMRRQFRGQLAVESYYTN